MGKQKAPKPPDYTPLANASKESAEYSYKLGIEQLAWAKEQDRMNRSITDRVINSALDISEEGQRQARDDRERYQRIFQPLEDSLAQEAKDFASPERQEQEAGRAMGTVATQFEAARQGALRNLESYGIDPTATRYAALDRGARIAQAAQSAGAGNEARRQTESVGRALRSEAINVGRGYPGQIAGQYGTALSGGNQAVNSGLATTASGAQTMGTAPQWQGMGNQAIGQWGNILNTGYQNQMAQFNANQQSSSGIGALAGTALSLFLEDGGVVPQEASPSGGEVTDDVPARLNEGEFVVPRDAVSWFGEKHFQELIEKAKKQKGEAQAKPQLKQALPMNPTFSTASAIPTG